jgi:AraC-like DNA-binding protein
VTDEGNVLIDWQLTEILLRGMAIGALCATAIAFARSGPGLSIRVAGLLFCASVMSFVLTSSPAWRDAVGPASVPIRLLSMGGGGYFWLFVVVLFEDRKITWANLAPAALLTALGMVAASITDQSLRANAWIAHNLIEMAFAAHALYVIYSSWRGDLVEARRRLRGPFLAVVTLYTIVLSGFEIGESFGVYQTWYSVAGALSLALFCLAGCLVFLEPRPALFGAATPPLPAPVPDEPRLDPADRVTLDRLSDAMGKGEAWRKEGLTIAALAEQVGTPEHRLRRLINDHLGHRNFAAYVNARRIEAAKAVLCDPAQARTTVAAIAFDLGFGSLGPFNRAFKDETGKTPTEWRRDALENNAPNSENPS